MMTCTGCPLANGSAARRTSAAIVPTRDAVAPDHVHLDIALADDHASDTPARHDATGRRIRDLPITPAKLVSEGLN